MAERVLVDNDVVLKISCYGLIDQALVATTVGGVPPAILGVGRFVIRSRLTKARGIADSGRARACFEHLLTTLNVVEPEDAELSLAAEFEAEASRRNLELDSGESQLLAVLVQRGCDLLLTGDKRAIAAIGAIAAETAASRIACLEQLMCQLIEAAGVVAIRPRVCAEPKVDQAVTICFGCFRPDPPQDHEVIEGLASYIAHLDQAAAGVLLPGIDLNAWHLNQ